MREYLFRGIGNNNIKIWRFGDLRIYKGNKASIWENDTGYGVDPKTVGQFTGFLDKNGMKIFEGDIIKYNDTKRFETIAKVGFKKGTFTSKVINLRIPSHPLLLVCQNCPEMEVIGNIYDNPELLEE